jgi:proteasome beta subunit
VGSGSLFARGSLKKLWRSGLDSDTAVSVVVEALYDAADDDSATGGPDLGRRIWPTVAVVDGQGVRFVADEALQQVVTTVVDGRHDNPGGAR